VSSRSRLLTFNQLVVFCAQLSGNEATLNFFLTNFTDVASLQSAIRNIQYLGGNTNTTGGLRLMRLQVFNPANGDRPEVPNVVILITDGIPTREVELLPGEVATIKDLGIRIVGVGVTNQVFRRRLHSLSVILTIADAF
jgi:Mg-chelatase subunit ChlD